MAPSLTSGASRQGVDGENAAPRIKKRGFAEGDNLFNRRELAGPVPSLLDSFAYLEKKVRCLAGEIGFGFRDLRVLSSDHGPRRIRPQSVRTRSARPQRKDLCIFKLRRLRPSRARVRGQKDRSTRRRPERASQVRCPRPP